MLDLRICKIYCLVHFYKQFYYCLHRASLINICRNTDKNKKVEGHTHVDNVPRNLTNHHISGNIWNSIIKLSKKNGQKSQNKIKKSRFWNVFKHFLSMVIFYQIRVVSLIKENLKPVNESNIIFWVTCYLFVYFF